MRLMPYLNDHPDNLTSQLAVLRSWTVEEQAAVVATFGSESQAATAIGYLGEAQVRAQAGI